MNLTTIMFATAVIILGSSFQIQSFHDKEVNGGKWTKSADGYPIYVYVPSKCSNNVVDHLVQLFEETLNIHLSVAK